jgi:putative two-component system response regulator
MTTLNELEATAGTQAFSGAAYAQLEKMMGDMRQLYQERNALLAEVTKAHHEALLRLALAAEMRDDDTGVHIVRIGFLAERLALLLGCDAAWSQQLRMAAPMHDVGKIGIPDAVLKKPGPLTPEERLVMNAHPKLGAEILGTAGVPLFRLAAEVSMCHHERWNGAGYPNGLVGEQIPMSGRIVAVVDFFDALTMDRCYRPAFSDNQALEMLLAESGEAFEPRLVDTFMANATELTELRDRVSAEAPSFRALLEPGGLARREPFRPPLSNPRE